MADIESLLHRSSDLSTFLVHLTRSGGGASALQNLESIITNRQIEARTAFGPARHLEPHLAGSLSTQKCVCFTETPMEHVWMMIENIEGRAVQFEPYGLAITKTTGRKTGFNPVWYSDITRRGVDWPAKAVNDLIGEAVDFATRKDDTVDVDKLTQEPILKITPFFEQMGPTLAARKEFWWEREWRKQGDFPIPSARKVVTLFAPEDDHEHLRTALKKAGGKWPERPILDPRWGLEHMIASLAAVPEEEIGPFPDAY